MNLLHLHYFKVLAEKEHLINTAKALHISPPALSSTIFKLKEELGVELFEHVGRNIRLNENGQMLYVHVCKIFAELDAIEQSFAKVNRLPPNTVNVAVAAPTTWIKVFEEFIKNHPDITVKHTTLWKEHFQNPEILDAYDLIITDIQDVTDASWEHKFIVEDAPTILVHQDHPLAKREVISLAEVKNEPFIALSKFYSPRDFFDKACKQAGFTPVITVETDYQLRTSLLEARTGIAFSSTLGANAIRSSTIKMLRVKSPPNPRIQTVFWKSGRPLSPSALMFRDYVVDYYRDEAR